MQAKPLNEVPKDFEPNKIKGVFNPTKEDITILYGGIPYTVKAGSYEQHPEPLSYHLAKHIAIRILSTGLNDFLLENFPGLDAAGRENWKVNQKHFYSKQDIIDLRNKLVFDHKIGDPAPVIPEVTPKYHSKKKTTMKAEPVLEDAATENLPVPEPQVLSEKKTRKQKLEE